MMSTQIPGKNSGEMTRVETITVKVDGKAILSLIAYLQRLGVDIKWQRPRRIPLADQLSGIAHEGGE